MAQKPREKKVEIVGLLGVGLDEKDGHRRITRGEEFVLLGGCAETHEHMQDAAIHLTESLKDRGKRLRDAECQEVLDLLQRALER